MRKTTIGYKCVYKRKEDPTKSEVTRFKARLVAKKFTLKKVLIIMRYFLLW